MNLPYHILHPLLLPVHTQSDNFEERCSYYMKKKQLSAVSVKYIINMLSLAVFAVSYMYIYTAYMDKAEKTYAEVGIIKQQINITKDKIARKDETIEKTTNMETDINKILDRYPLFISKVDNLLFVDRMEKALNTEFKVVDLTYSKSFTDTGVPVRSLPESGETGTMYGLESRIAMNFQTDYHGLKRVLDYVVKYPEHTAIESISVSRDDTTSSLNGSIVLKRYALTGTGKVYVQPFIEDIRMGTDDIFGLNSNNEQ